MKVSYPKAPWDVMGCQVATCFKAPGVSLQGSGVSIGGVRSLRVNCIFLLPFRELTSPTNRKGNSSTPPLNGIFLISQTSWWIPPHLKDIRQNG